MTTYKNQAIRTDKRILAQTKTKENEQACIRYCHNNKSVLTDHRLVSGSKCSLGFRFGRGYRCPESSTDESVGIDVVVGTIGSVVSVSGWTVGVTGVAVSVVVEVVVGANRMVSSGMICATFHHCQHLPFEHASGRCDSASVFHHSTVWRKRLDLIPQLPLLWTCTKVLYIHQTTILKRASSIFRIVFSFLNLLPFLHPEQSIRT